MIKFAILSMNNNISGWLDQHISILGKKYYIDFDIDVFVGIEEVERAIDEENGYYDIIGLDTKIKESMNIEFIKKIRTTNEKTIIIFLTKLFCIALPGIPTGEETKPISSFLAFKKASLYLIEASHS